MRSIIVIAALVLAAAPAAAQDRPFLFSVATTTEEKPKVRFDYDVGVGERAFQSDLSNRPEQRLGLHASFGRLTFLARVGIAEVGSAYQSSQSGEALVSLMRADSPFVVAAGGGVLHEAS